jgi:hypothetical protein
MVAESKSSRRLFTKVAEIYDWLDLQIRDSAELAGRCKACGTCCDFAVYDHRLFVTPPEWAYLAAKLGGKNIKPMLTSRCPYNIDGKCSVYKYRFAGCRIFCCSADKEFQSRLSESVLKKFRSLCTQLNIPYRYSDLAAVLSSFEAF